MPHWRCVWRPNAVFNLRGLGPQGDSAVVLAAWWRRQVTSPSSGCAALVLFHQRGKSWTVLWRAQWSALLYTREGYVLPLSLCRADAPSSASVALRASSAHGLSPLERQGPLERREWCRWMTSREAPPSADLSFMGEYFIKGLLFS